MRANYDMVIREENSADAGERSAIHAVHEAAFGGRDEADLVDNLSTDGLVLASVVAETRGRIVGHVLFSRMTIETTEGAVPAVALAPVAVLPDHQRRGIGAELIRHGLTLMCEQGESIVIVVGHADYYPRFGFSSARARSVESPFPADVFMALELVPGALDGVRGRVRYPPAFGVV